jgi:hypothetical protein
VDQVHDWRVTAWKELNAGASIVNGCWFQTEKMLASARLVVASVIGIAAAGKNGLTSQNFGPSSSALLPPIWPGNGHDALIRYKRARLSSCARQSHPTTEPEGRLTVFGFMFLSWEVLA